MVQLRVLVTEMAPPTLALDHGSSKFPIEARAMASSPIEADLDHRAFLDERLLDSNHSTRTDGKAILGHRARCDAAVRVGRRQRGRFETSRLCLPPRRQGDGRCRRGPNVPKVKAGYRRL